MVAISLSQLGRHAEALEHYGEIVDHFVKLVETEGRRELAGTLELVRRNREIVLQLIARESE